MRVCSLAFAAILGIGLVGCGDDDGGTNQNDAGVNQNDASTNDNDGGSNNNNNNTTTNLVLGDLDGTFLITSLKSPFDDSTLTFTRTETAATVDGSDVAIMLRGHMDFTASDDASGFAEVRIGTIIDHAVYFYFGQADVGVSLEASGGKLIWHLPDVELAYFTDYDGTVLTLTLDENDVRNQDFDGPSEYVLTRFTPTADEVTGSWSYTSITMDRGGHEVTVTDSCTAVESHWERLSGTATYYDTGFDTGQALVSEYDNNFCSGSPTDTNAWEVAGFHDVDETNKTLDLYQYLITMDQGVGATYDYTLNGTTLTLDVDASYPSGEWGATQIILEKL